MKIIGNLNKQSNYHSYRTYGTQKLKTFFNKIEKQVKFSDAVKQRFILKSNDHKTEQG